MPLQGGQRSGSATVQHSSSRRQLCEPQLIFKHATLDMYVFKTRLCIQIKVHFVLEASCPEVELFRYIKLQGMLFVIMQSPLFTSRWQSEISFSWPTPWDIFEKYHHLVVTLVQEQYMYVEWDNTFSLLIYLSSISSLCHHPPRKDFLWTRASPSKYRVGVHIPPHVSVIWFTSALVVKDVSWQPSTLVVMPSRG